MKRPDTALALLKWMPGALLVLRALRDGRSGPFAGISDAMALDLLNQLAGRGLLAFKLAAGTVRAQLTPLGWTALSSYDMETVQARPVEDDSEPGPDGPPPLNFDAPRHLPAFAFGAGK